MPDPLDFSKVKTIPLDTRPSKVTLSDAATPWMHGGTLHSFLSSLPAILGAKDFREVVQAIADASASSVADATAEAEVLVITIRPVGEEMKYEMTEFTVKSGQKVKVVMDNTAKTPAMQHNVVITKIGTDTNEVGMAAVAAGEAAGYIPADSDAILFYTPIAKPGEKTEVEFIAPPAGDYPYVCTFPGHFALMKGVMHSVE